MASPSGSEEPLPSKLTAAPSVPLYDAPGAAVGAWFVADGASWHRPLPASANVCPATGTNCQVYEPEFRVNLSTPHVVVFRTWLFATGGGLPPSSTAAGFCGARRS